MLTTGDFRVNGLQKANITIAMELRLLNVIKQICEVLS